MSKVFHKIHKYVAVQNRTKIIYDFIYINVKKSDKNIFWKLIFPTCSSSKSHSRAWKQIKMWTIHLDFILYYQFQRKLLDGLRYVVVYARFKSWVGDLLKISIKRAWVTSVLNIMSPRMSLSSRNKLYKA